MPLVTLKVDPATPTLVLFAVANLVATQLRSGGWDYQRSFYHEFTAESTGESILKLSR